MSEAGVPQFELTPQPPVEAGEQSQDKDVEKQHTASQESGVGKRAPRSSSGTATKPITDVQLPQSLPVTPKTPASSSTSAPTADLTADDVDLIEKQWIDRAKAIVAETGEDPYRQKSEMSKVKADYINKRFKKVIKTDDPVTK